MCACALYLHLCDSQEMLSMVIKSLTQHPPHEHNATPAHPEVVVPPNETGCCPVKHDGPQPPQPPLLQRGDRWAARWHWRATGALWRVPPRRRRYHPRTSWGPHCGEEPKFRRKLMVNACATNSSTKNIAIVSCCSSSCRCSVVVGVNA